MKKLNEGAYVEALINAELVCGGYDTRSPASVWLAVFQIEGCPPDAALVACEEMPTESLLWRVLPQCEEARAEGLDEGSLMLHQVYLEPAGIIKGHLKPKALRFEEWTPLLNAMIATIMPHIKQKPSPDLLMQYRDEHGRVCNVGGLVKEETWQAILNNTGNLTESEFLRDFSESVGADCIMKGLRNYSPAERHAAALMRDDIVKYRHPATDMEVFTEVLQYLQEWYDTRFLSMVNGDFDRTDVVGSLRTVMNGMVCWLGAVLRWDSDTVEHAQDYYYMNCLYPRIVQKEKP